MEGGIRKTRVQEWDKQAALLGLEVVMVGTGAAANTARVQALGAFRMISQLRQANREVAEALFIHTYSTKVARAAVLSR
jgi:hypothetical protein